MARPRILTISSLEDYVKGIEIPTSLCRYCGTEITSPAFLIGDLCFGSKCKRDQVDKKLCAFERVLRDELYEEVKILEETLGGIKL